MCKKEINTNMAFNYRKKYKLYYEIEFGKKYVVHHIDENRANNSIDNLLLLPNVLHGKYHQYKREAEMQLLYLHNIDLREPSICLAEDSYRTIKKYIKVCKECQKWIAYKQNLDYKIYIKNQFK